MFNFMTSASVKQKVAESHVQRTNSGNSTNLGANPKLAPAIKIPPTP